MRAWIARRLRSLADRIDPVVIVIVYGGGFIESPSMRRERAAAVLAEARKESN